MTLPPINQKNYSLYRDWFDNDRWLRPHSRDTKSTTRNYRAVDSGKIKTMLERR